jgi:predicted AAA+ superfamily ATPase
MYREFEETIQKWLGSSKKALLVYGARQVGKTYLIREMLNRNEISFCEFNLIERTDVLEAIRESDDSAEISEKFALYSDVELTDHESVVFLDEIQKYPEIITKIKFLVDEGRFRYILSGSNLGVELKGIRSIPVGYIESYQMFPLNFKEFATAIGISNGMLEHAEKCLREQTPIDNLVHEKLVKVFYYYLIVGGMPAVINVYNETHSLELIEKEQKSIIEQYKADFTRYEKKDRKLKVVSVYDNIPAQLNKQNRRFNFTLLNKELKFDRYEESFLWLKDAAVAIPSYIVSEPSAPLVASKETNVFKLFLSDVGLLTSCYSISVKKELLEMNPERELNNGALFENFVAQEIYARTQASYYYKKNGVGEVDFMTETSNGVTPIEVKSGKDYKKHAALNHLLEKHNFNKVYVVSLNNIETDGGIVYVPIYLVGTIFAEKPEDVILPAL